MNLSELKKEYPPDLFEVFPPFIPSGYRMVKGEPLTLGVGLILKTRGLFEPIYFFFTNKKNEYELVLQHNILEDGLKIYTDEVDGSPRDLYLRQIEQNIRLRIKRNQTDQIKKIDCSYIFCTSNWLAFVPSTEELINVHEEECEGCEYCDLLNSDEFEQIRQTWEKGYVNFDPPAEEKIQEMPATWKLNSFHNMRQEKV